MQGRTRQRPWRRFSGVHTNRKATRPAREAPARREGVRLGAAPRARGKYRVRLDIGEKSFAYSGPSGNWTSLAVKWGHRQLRALQIEMIATPRITDRKPICGE
jgi:hypothetical protein